MCQIIPEVGPFRYLVSKKFHNHSVIIHLWRLWRSKTEEICKIYWKLMNFKRHFCFANISATKARIFLKFDTYIHKIVKKIPQHFLLRSVHTCAHTRRKRARARFAAMKRARASFCLVYTRLCTDLYEKFYDISLLSYEFKSQIS